MPASMALLSDLTHRAEPSSEDSKMLPGLIEATSPCCLQPFRFFVSWQGVLTVAYVGFPAALADLKQRITRELPELPRENPGSLWPKTTLAPLKDGQRLTPDQLTSLNALCRLSSLSAFGSLGDGQGVKVESAAIAIYRCRSLEKLISLQRVSFRRPPSDTAAAVSDAERERVERIVAEADHPEYWFAASKDGSRESHYRSSALGSTVMISLGSTAESLEANKSLLQSIRRFREEVERSFPGMYAWLGEDSYHVTLRAVMG